MNKTFLGGVITNAGVVNSVSDTQDVINYTVMTKQSYTDKEGNRKEQTQFHDCSQFFAKGKAGKTAELLTKGRVIEVKGRLKTSAPRKGQTRDKVEKMFVNKGIIVDRILAFGAKDVFKGGAEQAA